jgi:hypothetical protein
MRLFKVLSVIFFITFIALAYVHQQNEIFYLAYLGGKKQAALANLLDKNNVFRYNINRLSSLTCLDGNILRDADFEIPAVKQSVRFEAEQAGASVNPAAERKTNLILSFFGSVRQAQAQTLNR